ncbi:MAG TPA: hypothetical protein VHE37_05505 [Nevskiaceae bacterium]|nr:hypothetical protein [Nevskiaceae bacterium]
MPNALTQNPAVAAPLWRGRVLFRLMLEDHTDFFLGLQRWRFRHSTFRDNIVDRNTQVVIDGFPRSSNSFSVRAFSGAQRTPVRVGHHVHSHAQILKAVELGIPTVLLVRDPDQCIPSLKALNIQVSPAMEQIVSLEVYLRQYIRFHERVRPVLDRCVVASFEQTIADFGAVIDRLNARFGTQFDRYQHTAESQDRVFRSNTGHLSPSAQRDNIKQRLRDEYFSAANQPLVERARALYAEVSAAAQR